MPDKVDITNAKKSYRTRSEGDFPEILPIRFKKMWDLKYGENPNQHAAIYSIFQFGTKAFQALIDMQSVRSDSKGKGGLSLTNTMDIARAMDTLKYFGGEQAVAIMKHNIVAGFSRPHINSQNDPQVKLFRQARDADLRSNFGGTATFTQPLEMETAQAMYELKGNSPFFVDVVAAPEFNEGVIGYLENQSQNLRIARFSGLDNLPRFQGDDTHGLYSIKEIPGGMFGIQDLYLTSIRDPNDLVLRPYVTKEENQTGINRAPTINEAQDLLTSWWLNITGARSNGIVAVKNGTTVAMGSGQVERVGAVEQAIIKGMQKAMDREDIAYDPLFGIKCYEQLSENPFRGASVSSDAFFPFSDSIERLARVGVTAVIQPYGSMRDNEVIEAANKYNMAMPATLERCFGHF